MIAAQPVALVANKSFAGSTVADVVAEAKRQPTNYTSPGPRGVGDLAGQMLKQRAGIPRRISLTSTTTAARRR